MNKHLFDALAQSLKEAKAIKDQQEQYQRAKEDERPYREPAQKAIKELQALIAATPEGLNHAEGWDKMPDIGNET